MEILLVIILVLVLVTPFFINSIISQKISKQGEKFNTNILEVLQNIKINNKNKISFKKDFEITSMPILTVKMFKNEYKFILDTGADFNALDKTAFERIIAENDLEIIPEDLTDGQDVVGGQEVFGCNGVETNIKNIGLPFTCDNKDFFEVFSLVSIGAPLNAYEAYGINLCGVIGSPFFEKNKWVLDFDNLVVWTDCTDELNKCMGVYK